MTMGRGGVHCPTVLYELNLVSDATIVTRTSRFPPSRVYFFHLLLWPSLCHSWFQGNDLAYETLALPLALSLFWPVFLLSNLPPMLSLLSGSHIFRPQMLQWAQGSSQTQNGGPFSQEGSSCAGGQSCNGDSGNRMHNIKEYVIGIEPRTQERTWLPLEALDERNHMTPSRVCASLSLPVLGPC